MIDGKCPDCGSADYDRYSDDKGMYWECENCGFKGGYQNP